MSAVKKCIVCGSEEISLIGGHVHKEEEKVIAYFCNNHKDNKPLNNNCRGCYGDWKEEMGYDKSFGEVAFLHI